MLRYVGCNKLRELQIDSALKQKGHGRLALGGDGALELEVGVCALDSTALHVDHRILIVDMNGRCGGELDVVAIGTRSVGMVR